MLSSIHPLGERGRHNKWWLTVGAFTFGAVTAGGAVGAVLGAIGQVGLSGMESSDLLVATATIAVVAGILDMSTATPPGPERQVNETWIGAYRGWVYGGGFGLQLGAGFLTYIVTWGVPAMLFAELLTVSTAGGALVGGAFGLARSVTLLIAAPIDTPSRLTSFNRRLAATAPVMRSASSVGMTALGATTLAVIML